MILIKRNTPEFKEVKNLVSEYTDSSSAKKYILLYSMKPYQELKEKILLNTVKKDGAILYSLAYDSLREYICSNTKKLFREEKESIYYFKTSSASASIELPFAFAGKLKKSLSKLLMKPTKLVERKIIPLKQTPRKKAAGKKSIA
ncbi:MAG: hypothetical protein K0S26_3231 [Bacteroidota bacterium]|nr:hypothetical protein [Bacteroidota bacterium]